MQTSSDPILVDLLKEISTRIKEASQIVTQALTQVSVSLNSITVNLLSYVGLHWCKNQSHPRTACPPKARAIAVAIAVAIALAPRAPRNANPQFWFEPKLKK